MTDEPRPTRQQERDSRLEQSLSAVARQVQRTVTDDVGEALVGIATYEDGEYNVRYRDDVVAGQYTDADIAAILENIQLDGIGVRAYEDYHDQSLHGTVRVYDHLATVTVPLAETAGIVVVLRTDTDHDPYAVIETVETAAGVQ